MPVLVFLIGHLTEHFRGGGVAFLQVLGESQINARVLFFGGDGYGKDFSLGQIGKILGRVRQSGEHDCDLLRTILSRMYSAQPGKSI